MVMDGNFGKNRSAEYELPEYSNNKFEWRVAWFIVLLYIFKELYLQEEYCLSEIIN